MNYIDEINSKIKSHERNKQRLIDLYVDEQITKSDYENRYKEYEKKLGELQVFLKKTSDLVKEYSHEQRKLEDFKQAMKEMKHMEEFDPVIFEKLVEKVYVGGKDSEGNYDPFKLDFVQLGFRISWGKFFP